MEGQRVEHTSQAKDESGTDREASQTGSEPTVVASTAEGNSVQAAGGVVDGGQEIKCKEFGDQDRPLVSKSDEELDREVEEALACPCIADLRDGACGKAFVASFSCFIKSKENERGMDCLEPFEALQECMIEHPEEFADFIKPKDGDEEQPPSMFPNINSQPVASGDDTSQTKETQGNTPAS